ncbi:pantothenate kinase [Cyanobacterium stanieri LEGE 03274]|uniref:Type III pantothenate kinase n=1 Tax=Cyanobacterium stanieri LEGE 03274 TaxID=1828756 RepID=A0ABR9V5Y1_9CHRO|nr:pantothenate kinase [Cyanobacterium stanieri]MBE9223298.1 pantothenate kinase [Cyanobacterium stanieri LEGE 03274]
MSHENWLGLMIGNSRLHWAYFADNQLQETWNTIKRDSLRELEDILPPVVSNYLKTAIPLYVASVVPSATRLYLQLPQTIIIDVRSIPIQGIYKTMGCDRTLALWGGGCKYQFPCLVIDSGTALTFTGANENQELVGGAILPGVKLQMETLFFNTAALPEVEILEDFIPRWAKNTPNAIQSGIIYSILGGIKGFIDDWLEQYPSSSIILTGGDTILLKQYFAKIYPFLADKIIFDSDLIFYGMKEYKLNI